MSTYSPKDLSLTLVSFLLLAIRLRLLERVTIN